MSVITAIIIGRSGSGKGTQAKLLKEYLEKTTGKEVVYISTGDKMREAMELGNETSHLINEKIMKSGSFAPPALAIWAWMDAFIREGLDNDKHLILDGAPRRPDEAEMLADVLHWHERRRVIPIALDVSAEEATRRLLARQRADDTEEKIKNRLAFYELHAIPTFVVLQWRCGLYHVRAEGDKFAVQGKILKIINEK